MPFRSVSDSPQNQCDAMHVAQTGNRPWGRLLCCVAAMAAFLGAAEPGQTPQAPAEKPIALSSETNRVPDAKPQMALSEGQLKESSLDAASLERKKQIAEDSALLLKLATDLKLEVDKTNKDTLSLSVIRKADELEKLAHTVKEKLK